MEIMNIVKGKRKGVPQPAKTIYTKDIVRAVARKQRYKQRTVADILRSVFDEIEGTVAQVEYAEKRLFLLWDGASYHRGVEMQEYLEGVNLHLARDAWRVTCSLFAPHAPEQNPIEDVWLKAKQYVRKHWRMCQHFKDVMHLFEEAFDILSFQFEKLHMYLPFL